MKYIHVLFQHYEELKVSIHIQLICSHKIEIDTTLQCHGYRDVKFHHKFGSSEWVKVLNEHGIVTTYDEVIRFHKSAAKYSGNGSIVHEAIGLMRRVGPIFGWFDNFDLLVCTPNGRCETHAMAIEFQQHPSGVLECGSPTVGLLNLAIPRLYKREVAYIRLGSKSVVMERYTGPKKVKPLLVVCR